MRRLSSLMHDVDHKWLVERISPSSSVLSMRRVRIAQYRRQAAGIQAKVENMKDQALREQFLDIARQYEALATSIARLPLPRDD